MTPLMNDPDQPGGDFRVTLASLPVPQGEYRKVGKGLFSRACSDRTRRNGCKVKEDVFRLDIKGKSSSLQVW